MTELASFWLFVGDDLTDEDPPVTGLYITEVEKKPGATLSTWITDNASPRSTGHIYDKQQTKFKTFDMLKFKVTGAYDPRTLLFSTSANTVYQPSQIFVIDAGDRFIYIDGAFLEGRTVRNDGNRAIPTWLTAEQSQKVYEDIIASLEIDVRR